jgi:hypothetical protein
MPDEAPEVVEVETIVKAVEAGTDGIAVPEELIVEIEKPPPAVKNLYAQIATMGIAEKIKLALRGNKDARLILVRDTNKMVRRLVMMNPRVSDGEVIAVARNRSADDELLRMIAAKREWVRNYQIRQALVTNPKTPLPIALRQMTTLSEQDMRQLAKSRNVAQAVAAQARRILATQQRE